MKTCVKEEDMTEWQKEQDKVCRQFLAAMGAQRITQTALSGMTGINRGVLNNLFNLGARMQLGYIKRISEALNVTVQL
jgi:Cro/C1-type HTH DNA-binding domain